MRVFLRMIFLGLFMLAPALVWGQANATGNIIGQVTDQSGAVIAGATVSLTNVGTKAVQEQPTNHTGRFAFVGLPIGAYDISVSKPGFRVVAVPNQSVTLSQTLTLNLTMEVGATTQTVEVQAAPGAELQTESSAMGATLNNTTMLDLPSVNRDVSALLNLQPTAAPTFHGTVGDIMGGSIAGATPDQNTFMLDGSNNTSGLEGDNGYINGFSGDQRGVVPTPIESIGEVTVNTNNMTADFNTSSGGELLATTKGGTDQFHGAAYDFFQGDWLNSNSWGNNFSAVTKPKSHQNRYGFDVGGPLLPKHVLGGGTYFFVNYEAQRYPFNQTGQFYRTVPSAALRQGIITIPTAEGNQTFDLNQPLNICGPNGGLPCDPRNTGMSSAVSTVWQKYMPAANYTQGGNLACNSANCDGFNTFTYAAGLTLPLENDEWIGRMDHDFGSKNRWTTTYRWFKQDIPTTNEVDIGGLLKGDTLGKAASAASNNNQPFVFNTSLTSTITPTLTNSFHYGYTRNEWNWIRNGPQTPQVAGSAAPLEIDGESTNALIPVNVDTQNSRNRAWYEHNSDFRDEVTWLKGNHMFQFGGDMLHEWWHFNRYDNVVGGLTNLIYEVDNGSVAMTPDFQPRPCGNGVTTQCLDPGNSSELDTWNKYYADVLGIVNHSSIVATRTGSDLSLNPLGTPAASYVTVNTPSVYINDSWKIRPNITVNMGLNYMVQMPPHDLNGRQDVLVDPSGNPITYASFIAQRQSYANNGQVYTPVEGFSPVGAVNGGAKYPFNPYYGAFGPRISMAWSPSSDSGWLGKLLGTKATVIRGGYGRFYSRDLGINIVSNPILGDGFLQPVSCIPTMTGGCTSVRGVDPSTAFRIGSNADGLNVPLPALTPTLPLPVQPGVNAPTAVLTDSMDMNFRPNSTDQVDFSIQRQLKNNIIVEVGYVGVFGAHLFQGIDMNAVPWMTKVGGQTFAQAYAALWTQLHNGTATNAVSAQPFFEGALGGTNSSFCKGSSSCTAAMAANAGPYITTEDVTDTWAIMESSGSWALNGPNGQPTQALYTDTGQSAAFGPYANTSNGFSNYQALVMKFTERTSHGLTLNANATYGHALGTLGLAQTYTLDTPDNVFNLASDWTPQPWDRKFTMNVLGAYALPFGTGQRWTSSNGAVSRVISGWSVSPIFTYGSGLPVEFYTGGLEMGAGYAENGSSAVPVNISTASLSNSHNQGVTVCDPSSGCSGNPNSVGVNGNPGGATGSGANMFKNPVAVYNSFRPFILGVDGAPSPDGNLRGPIAWNLDLGVNKETRITERVGLSLYGHFFNVFNHDNWNAPSLNLQGPTSFGVMTGGFGDLGNYTRVIELGARVSF
ncbi:MAG TPA: carboxypeptidase-like regulatory domain-containing protein [Terriglobia bacterium]|nr:carboxypeptidase-like regulatory domain-containing protein [Terriglobia bacterium]